MTADQPQPGPPPGGPEPHYRPCRRCPRCTTGTGRPPTAEQDCWDAFLTGTVTAMAERRRRERHHEEAQAALDPSPGTAAGRNPSSAEVGSGPRW
ncbi:hypothetical protein ACFVT9_14115 [Kitasatospora cineracea]|uniref:hypothetical protein n=1 Tax=Kitasatospora TaxID=2063 RepID=UPI0022839079|nr:hypothetical protein [Kitasatospora sp. YST-16]WAL71231.1 hypothetical protein OU787_06800 [Kitasatospora sp. YST-16]WNW37267.1 hypothetical protein RKE32_06745 [Streptomyces sp. Li-HN-5-13]